MLTLKLKVFSVGFEIEILIIISYNNVTLQVDRDVKFKNLKRR